MITVLFARHDSVYKSFPDCDVWDAERDARKWSGGTSIIAHPPCRSWGRLRGLAHIIPEERALGPLACALAAGHCQSTNFGGGTAPKNGHGSISSAATPKDCRQFLLYLAKRLACRDGFFRAIDRFRELAAA